MRGFNKGDWLGHSPIIVIVHTENEWPTVETERKLLPGLSPFKRESECLGQSFVKMVSTELKINGERLWETIQETAKWGAIPNSTGMCRLSCSDEDQAVREWFLEQTAQLGCTHKVRGF